MSITNENTENVFTGNGVTTVFPTNIVAFTEAQVYVYLREGDTDTLQTLTTHYTITDLEESGGITVTFLAAPTALQEVVVVRITPKRQELILTSTRAYNPEVVMEQMDLLVMMMQELAKQQERTFRVKAGITVPTELDDPDALADALDIIAAVLSGTGWQVADAKLSAIVAAAWAANKLLYLTGAGTLATTDFTAYGRTLAGLADQAALRAQALNTLMTSIAALSVVQGDLILGSGVDAVTKLAKGTARQILAMNVGATGLEYVSPYGIRLARKTASASSSLDFTEFANSLYSAYLMTFERVLPATDATSLMIRLSTNGGVSYDAGASDYSNARTQKIAASAEDDSLGGSSSAIILASNVGNAAGEQGFNGKLILYNTGVAQRLVARWDGMIWDAAAGGTSLISGTGTRQADQDTDALRVLCSSGNITSGVVTLYGIP